MVRQYVVNYAFLVEVYFETFDVDVRDVLVEFYERAVNWTYGVFVVDVASTPHAVVCG